ncbi:beta-propeller fold lactonase family protein [Streptococcus ratti]|uniref:beta-propeller fold lactonase family protein n=1 Tax=Streptococcus ratti TaxID=1341 RepID=UPI001FE706BE|nr:beta-propeller fold lactonase family protein [Streptococcus ratti]
MIETVYFGIYTRHTPKRNYTARFDTERGTLSDLELLAAKENPTYLAFDRHNHLSASQNKLTETKLSALLRTIKLINRVLEADAPLCHLIVGHQDLTILPFLSVMVKQDG